LAGFLPVHPRSYLIAYRNRQILESQKQQQQEQKEQQQ
jgi:hypothetical protein